VVRHQLSQVAAALPSVPTAAAVDREAAEAVRAGTAGQAPERSPGSLLPPAYEQARSPATSRGAITRPDIER
jgi:hypothetical protein